jgi:uncharacterized membrane protein
MGEIQMEVDQILAEQEEGKARPTRAGLLRGLVWGIFVEAIFGAVMLGLVASQYPRKESATEPPMWVIFFIWGALIFGPTIGMIQGAITGGILKANGTIGQGTLLGAICGAFLGVVAGGLLLTFMHPSIWIRAAIPGSAAGFIIGGSTGAIIGAMISCKEPRLIKGVYGASAAILGGAIVGCIVQAMWWKFIDRL